MYSWYLVWHGSVCLDTLLRAVIYDLVLLHGSIETAHD